MLVQTMTTPAIQDLVQKSFVTEIFRAPDDVRQVFHKITSDWTVDRKRVQEMDRERYAEQKTEGGPSAQRGISQGYAKEGIRKVVSVERKVSGEEYKALTAHGLAQMATGVGADIVDKIELDMRNFLGMGTGTSYTDNGGYPIDTTVGDGFALFYTAHTLKNSSITVSNILSGAPSLSEDAIEAAEDHFTYNIRDNNGQQIKMKPNTIITSSKAIMKNRVRRLFGSSSPETINLAENQNSGVLNVNKGKDWKHLVIDFDCDALGAPDSTKSFNWMVACLGGSPEVSLQAYYCSWMSPESAPVEVDQSHWTLSWVARVAYSIFAVSWKGILLSQASY